MSRPTSSTAAAWPRRPPATTTTTTTNNAKIRRRLVIHGQVQGVFFRDSLRRMADERGVAGWVKNNDDGTVEAVLEGDRDAIDALRSFAGQGPRGATVERLEDFEEALEGLTGFTVC